MKNTHLFPWWAGYFLINPLRKLSLDPYQLFSHNIKEGMTVIDAGCAMGYFSIPAAKIVGPSGMVLCVDLQEKMLSTLRKRAANAGVEKQLKTRKCTAEWLMINDLSGKADAAIAFGVIHEVPDEESFISDLYNALKPGGILIAGEPKSRVHESDFSATVKKIETCGFNLESTADYTGSRIAVFKKN